ncbi:hypothetical protein [Pseudogemmobacter blasticus]|uniref:Uncharacterized protein n=1 Tax=Fuscovulum blasticum DSM 2131 TaxID=1188250 RepID=A0A2T4JC54_FUSBL|nr:hypothetical protein [Fuscovulum blasticum]PTE15398.1 hypothetical protein C5F44_06260 [Fuscovulum blasticum DSM 2131]
MLRRLALTLTLLSVPLAGQAEDAPVLATYWANSGSLPPEYAWDVSVTILADGHLTLKHCKGYETEGPACKTRKATVGADALAGIRAAVTEQGLDRKPARKEEDIPVGGGASGGAVYLDGQKINLPAFPAKADIPRVNAVLTAITAAIPQRLRNRFLKDT